MRQDSTPFQKCRCARLLSSASPERAPPHDLDFDIARLRIREEPEEISRSHFPLVHRGSRRHLKVYAENIIAVLSLGLSRIGRFFPIEIGRASCRERV